MPFPHEAILGLDFFSALVDAFLQITRGLRPLVILGNASTCAEKKSNPRIASWGKDTFNRSLLSIYLKANLYYISFWILYHEKGQP